jgi:hypothetical protein
MITAINAWLKSNGPYSDGLQLLKEFGDLDGATLFYLDLGETSVSRADLTTALQELHDAVVRRTIARPERNPQPAMPMPSGRSIARTLTSDGYQGVVLPDQLQQVREDIKTWKKEQDYLRANLESRRTDAERAVDAKRILQLEKWIDAGYHRLDTWSNTGTDPGDVVVTHDPIKALKRIRNLTSYISRAKERGSSADEVKAWKQEKDKLQKELDAHSTK